MKNTASCPYFQSHPCKHERERQILFKALIDKLWLTGYHKLSRHLPRHSRFQQTCIHLPFLLCVITYNFAKVSIVNKRYYNRHCPQLSTLHTWLSLLLYNTILYYGLHHCIVVVVHCYNLFTPSSRILIISSNTTSLFIYIINLGPCCAVYSYKK